MGRHGQRSRGWSSTSSTRKEIPKKGLQNQRHRSTLRVRSYSRSFSPSSRAEVTSLAGRYSSYTAVTSRRQLRQ
eukprot:6207195-Pleurochrysis_carterae.AAC.8